MYTYSVFHRYSSEQRKDTQTPEHDDTTVPPPGKHVGAMFIYNRFLSEFRNPWFRSFKIDPGVIL